MVSPTQLCWRYHSLPLSQRFVEAEMNDACYWRYHSEWKTTICLANILNIMVVDDLGPVSLTFFACNSNTVETSPCHYSVAGHQIATNFCTCHDSTATVPCTKFCSDHGIKVEVRVKQNFRRIWIAMEKTLVKRGPGPSCDESNQVISSHGIELICAWYSSWSWNIMHKLVQYHG